MLQGISDATNIGIYHAATTKISKQKRIATAIMIISTKIRAITLIYSIDFTKIGHHLFLNSKSLNPPLGITNFG